MSIWYFMTFVDCERGFEYSGYSVLLGFECSGYSVFWRLNSLDIL